MIPESFLSAIELAAPSWRPVLKHGLETMNAVEPAYLPSLAQDEYLPTQARLFAAFAQPLEQVRYVLVGEGPYPREQSATGFCFMEGAGDEVWSEQGVSKRVKRATSLRNFMKMLMVAEGLLLNAALVFRPEVAPAKDAKAWRPLIKVVLESLLERSEQPPPTLVLWGKIAQWLEELEPVAGFPKAVAEHPYNLSFIAHSGMQRLFGPMKLLHLR